MLINYFCVLEEEECLRKLQRARRCVPCKQGFRETGEKRDELLETVEPVLDPVTSAHDSVSVSIGLWPQNLGEKN